MIWYYISEAIRSFFVILFATLHVPIITVLPFGMDDTLLWAMGIFRWFTGVFWWLDDIFISGMFLIGYFVMMYFLRQLRLHK